MNWRLKESYLKTLMWKASQGYNDSWSGIDPEVLEKFAELVVADHRVEKINYLHFIIEDLLSYVGAPPDKNCSCHISPPCSDCVDYSHLRDVIASAKAALKEGNEPCPL